MSARGPATTHSSSALTAARSSAAGSTARSSASASGTASIAASVPLARSISADRVTTSETASS